MPTSVLKAEVVGGVGGGAGAGGGGDGNWEGCCAASPATQGPGAGPTLASAPGRPRGSKIGDGTGGVKGRRSGEALARRGARVVPRGVELALDSSPREGGHGAREWGRRAGAAGV